METLPYNPNNVLVFRDHIEKLLSEYDVSDKVNNIDIYRKAFVHKSYCTRKNENFVNGNIKCPDDCIPLQEDSNETLEFHGDAILNIIVTEYLFERYPEENEGFLTRMRTKLVNGRMLAKLSSIVGLDKYVLISKQIDENMGRQNLNILEDTFEAFLAAIRRDLGYKAAQTWVISVIENNIDFADLVRDNNNFKDILLKFFQQNKGYIPKFFEINVDTKKNNSKIYTVCIKDIDNNVISTGKGPNRKDAEMDASLTALKTLCPEFRNV